MSTATSEKHWRSVVRDSSGVPTIRGSSLKVVDLVRALKAYSYGPEELATAYSFLSREQIEAVLSFYAEHRQELDDDLARRDRESEEILLRIGQPPVAEKLAAAKRSRGR